jgi:hypothetical protein
MFRMTQALTCSRSIPPAQGRLAVCSLVREPSHGQCEHWEHSPPLRPSRRFAECRFSLGVSGRDNTPIVPNFDTHSAYIAGYDGLF